MMVFFGLKKVCVKFPYVLELLEVLNTSFLNNNYVGNDFYFMINSHRS